MPSGPELLERARQWVASYWNARHLYRTLDWLFVLEPSAGLALRIAALTHDMERHYPGPDAPVMDARFGIPNRAYEQAHQERSARIVAAWLTEQGADPALVEAVRQLVAAHEWGGWPEADLLQAADSLSFLEVNAERFIRLGLTGERGYTPERVAQHFRYMADRIRSARARSLAQPLLQRALAQLAEHTARALGTRQSEATADG